MKMNPPGLLLAPCGLNCTVCYAHLRRKRTCPGCRGQETDQPQYCRKCRIRDCALSRGYDFCFECTQFPCPPVKRLDKRYRLRYQVGLIENLLRLKTVGIEQHVLEETRKWTCADCGKLISQHDKICSGCGKRWDYLSEKL